MPLLFLNELTDILLDPYHTVQTERTDEIFSSYLCRKQNQSPCLSVDIFIPRPPTKENK